MKFIQILFLFISLMITQSAFARKDFTQGYIVNLEGDTIRGMIKDRDPSPFFTLYSKIRFIQDGQRRVKKYAPSQIKAYGYGSVSFRSVRLREQGTLLRISYFTDNIAPFVFLKVIESNQNLILYEQEFTYEDNDVLDAFPLFHIPGSNQMVRVTQGVFGLKKKRLSEYFSFCPTLIEAIEEEAITTPSEVFEFFINSCVGE